MNAFDIYNAKINRYIAQGYDEQTARGYAAQEMKTNPNIINALKTDPAVMGNQQGGDWKSTLIKNAITAQVPQDTQTEEPTAPADNSQNNYGFGMIQDPIDTNGDGRYSKEELDEARKNGILDLKMQSDPEYFQTKQQFQALEPKMEMYAPGVIQTAFGTSMEYAQPTRGLINAIRAIRNNMKKDELSKQEAKVLEGLNQKFEIKLAAEKDALTKGGGSGGSGSSKTQDYHTKYQDIKKPYKKEIGNGIIVEERRDKGEYLPQGIAYLAQAVTEGESDDVEALTTTLLEDINESSTWESQSNNMFGGDLKLVNEWKGRKKQQLAYQLTRWYEGQGETHTKAIERALTKIAEVETGIQVDGSTIKKPIKVNAEEERILGLFATDYQAGINELKANPKLLESIYSKGMIDENSYKKLKGLISK